jgi:hypothetical protein
MDLSTWSRENVQKLAEDLMAKCKEYESKNKPTEADHDLLEALTQEFVDALRAENKQLKADLRTAIDASRQYILEADRANKKY